MGIVKRPDGDTNREYDSVLGGFNWGAFFFDWIWGLAHGCISKMTHIFICYVLFMIPFLNIFTFIWYIILKINYGRHGNEWAYDGRAFYNPKDFVDTQKRWAAAALCVVVLGILLSPISASARKSRYRTHKTATGISKVENVQPVTSIIVKEIIAGEKVNGTFSSGQEAVVYLLSNSDFIKSNEYKMSAKIFGKNAIQMYLNDKPDTISYLFVVNKNANCKLSAKNCSVILYPEHKKGEKVIAIEKMYFDNYGATKQVKFKK